MADYLTLQDLYNLVGTRRVKQYFDDDIDGDISDDVAATGAILDAAEAEAYSRMLRSWGKDAIIDLANADQAFKNHVAWIALEFASERRTEFSGNDGKGHFWAQYERALQYFDNISKGKDRTVGEDAAGRSQNEGGIIQPDLPTDDSPRFVFAPDGNAPTGHGGY